MNLPVQFVEFTAKGVVTLQTEEITTDNLARQVPSEPRTTACIGSPRS